MMAWREQSRQAISLLELTIVVVILSVLTIASLSRYGHNALTSGGAEGVARKLSLALIHTRRATIATGDNHFLQLTTSGGSVTSYALIRRASGGDTQVDETRNVPAGVTVTSADSTLEFDFDGAALGSYSPDCGWT